MAGYGFACKGCRTGLVVVSGTPPRPPFQTTFKKIQCSHCHGAHEYVGRMVRVTAAVER